MKYRCEGWEECQLVSCSRYIPHEKVSACGTTSGTCEFTCIPIKEKQMKKEGYEETVEFKVRDIKKAYDNGCEDVKKVLKDMCPEVFEEEYCCEWMAKEVDRGFIVDKKNKEH